MRSVAEDKDYYRQTPAAAVCGRVSWAGLDAELVERAGGETAEFRVRQPLHVLFHQPRGVIPAMELRHGGGRVRISARGDNTVSFTPADVDHWVSSAGPNRAPISPSCWHQPSSPRSQRRGSSVPRRSCARARALPRPRSSRLSP